MTYNYDSQNRLVSVYQGANEVASYTYDSAGRRHSKSLPNGPTTTYLYDNDTPANVLVEYQNGTWVRAFVYGPGTDEPLCMIEPDGDIYYYHQDALGNVIALSDSTGALVERYSYDVFGKPEQASSVGNPYMFTGRRYDTESGLYYYRVRMYHPVLGRFLQTDPIGYEDGINWYAYCGNNPGNFIDPLGLEDESPPEGPPPGFPVPDGDGWEWFPLPQDPGAPGEWRRPGDRWRPHDVPDGEPHGKDVHGNPVRGKHWDRKKDGWKKWKKYPLRDIVKASVCTVTVGTIIVIIGNRIIQGVQAATGTLIIIVTPPNMGPGGIGGPGNVG